MGRRHRSTTKTSGLNRQHQTGSAPTVRHSAKSIEDYQVYAAELVERVRAVERAGGRVSDTNLVSDLMTAEANEQITQGELIAMFMVLLFAATKQRRNLIGNGFFAILQHPDQWRLVHDDAALVSTAVEELFRYDGPAVATMREAIEDFTLEGVDIAAGDSVVIVMSAANRDEAVFAEPNVLNVSRRPNTHFGLGIGAHFCLGAPLARLESRIAFETLARRVPGTTIATDPDQVRYHPHVILRGLESLPVTLAG